MTLYNVHLYREMRLVFLDIEADSPEEAAEACREFPDEAACGAAVDCDGETFAALVDVQGDFEHAHSVVIDFEAERIRKAAPNLLAALKVSEGIVHWALDHGADREATAATLGYIRTAIAGAEAAASAPAETSGTDISAVLAAKGQIAAIWSVEDVLSIRPDLSEAQAGEVLRAVEHHHDCNHGITWDTLEDQAARLFGPAPESDEAEGA